MTLLTNCLFCSFSLFPSHDKLKHSRASVIRAQVVDLGGQGITGVRVGVSTDPMVGFILTRESGWFDLMVNGGGSITLHLQREPFKSIQKVVNVPINEIVVLEKILLTLDGQAGTESLLSSTVSSSVDGKSKSQSCADHDYEKMKPTIVSAWRSPFQNGPKTARSALLAESQIVQEAFRVPGTDVNLVYHSSRASGHHSTIELQLTPDKVEPSL